ncbi:MAG: hypothetical protein RIQ72_319 [Candidatus Parcubacteria bacterium]|jgi:hypothetical protein
MINKVQDVELSPKTIEVIREALKDTFVTKEEFGLFTRHVDKKFEAIDRKFDEFRDILIETTNHLALKIDTLSARIDASIKQNALEHNSFDVRLNALEG